VVHCFRDRWWEGWLKRGWLNSAKKPVANRDLWEPLIEEYRRDPQRLKFRWVKGHSNDPMNDLVDRLAVEAALTQSNRSGTEPPSVHPVGVVGERTDVADALDPRVPAGHRMVVVGLKPPQLGGYDDNFVTEEVRRKLAEVLAAKRQMHPDAVVLSGLGLGAEQLGAEAAVEAGVPFVAVLPYPDPDDVWPPASRERFRSLLAKAEAEVLMQPRKPENKQKAGAALSRRDAWLYRHADEAIAVWDGQDDAVGRMVRSLQDHLGEQDVWVIEP
jgi:uncharacterized phage-like protein YoqJ